MGLTGQTPWFAVGEVVIYGTGSMEGIQRLCGHRIEDVLPLYPMLCEIRLTPSHPFPTTQAFLWVPNGTGLILVDLPCCL